MRHFGPRLPLLALGLLLCTAAGCTRVPQLENRISPELRNQPYPKLLPLDSALAQQPLPEEETAALTQDLDARAARLRRRAEALRNRTP
ncbi:hypothetical protein HCZ87_08660 [Phaeobacter sp. HF9A]|nr:hypothetical protein [Phaeobacter sp. HF9A]